MSNVATNLAIVPPKESALEVYRADRGLDPYLAKIREEIDGFVPDVSTRKGRDAIASIAYKVSQSKTALDNVGKELVAELKAVPAKIDAERKRMRDLLDGWRDEVRKPLTEWEQAEADRIAKIEAQIQLLRDTNVETLFALGIKQRIEWLEEAEIDQRYGEFEADAHRAKAASLVTLRDALAKREQYEAEQAELVELRRKQAEQDQKDREERIAREAAENAKRIAEQTAQAEREAADRRERELKQQADNAARLMQEAVERAEQAERDAAKKAEFAAAAERQREENRKAEEDRAARAREADVAHKTAVLTAAKEAFMAGGFDEDQARTIVRLIKAEQIPGVSIAF